MEIAIISDTHMPRGPRRLPEACLARLRDADLILHAGDLFTLGVLRELETLGRVVAVQGNADDTDVRAVLPAAAAIRAEGHRIAMVHDSGAARGRMQRLRRRFPDVEAVVFGHSHIPLHERAADGFQIFNPGSPTERRRAPTHTMGVARSQARELSFELIDLG